MFDIDDAIGRPAGLVLWALRALWWLAWDFCVQTIGWSIGWLFLRAVTLGRFPSEGIGSVDEAEWGTQLFVEVVGLSLLAWAIWWLSGALP